MIPDGPPEVPGGSRNAAGGTITFRIRYILPGGTTVAIRMKIEGNVVLTIRDPNGAPIAVPAEEKFTVLLPILGEYTFEFRCTGGSYEWKGKVKTPKAQKRNMSLNPAGYLPLVGK